MSLQTDSAFIAAINSSKELTKKIGSRIYSTFIAEPKQGQINRNIPYILVTFDGAVNTADYKDLDDHEGPEDTVTVTIELTAQTRQQLADIATLTRRVIRQYFNRHDDDPETPSDYSLQASAVSYDQDAPCYWQTLTYECITQANND